MPLTAPGDTATRTYNSHKRMTREDIIQPENLVYQKPRLLNDMTMHYCPGCSHGVVHKLIAEVIDEMGMQDHSIGISTVG